MTGSSFVADQARRTDGPLRPAGHEQARQLAAHLARTRRAVRGVYTSPLTRARRTAEPIAAALGLPVHVEPGLAEYGIGTFEGTSYADLTGRIAFFEQAHGDLDWAPAGGESLRGVAERTHPISPQRGPARSARRARAPRRRAPGPTEPSSR